MSSFPCAVPGINLNAWTSPIARGFGQPCREKMATVTLTHGARVSVHVSLAELVGLIMNANEAQGYIYRKADTGAYNCRANANNPALSSWHSFGIAVDSNWQTNPNRFPVVTDRPSWEIQRWNRYGWGWGGDYDPSNPPDTMHTEYHGTVAQAMAALKLARQELAGITSPAPAPVPAPPAAIPPPPGLPGWVLPAGHYYGLITGPAKSHGGFYANERPAIMAAQQRLIAKGYVPGVADWRSGWADGKFEQATVDAVTRFQRAEMPGTRFFGQLWSDDWARLGR